MLKKLVDRFTKRSRAFNARQAAEGTYETIRQAIIFGKASSREEIDEQILARLATRRSWRRLDRDHFAVRWGRAERQITVVVPIDIGTFFRDVTSAEIDVFCAEAADGEKPELQEIGRRELQRLFARDGLPWGSE